MEKVFKDRRTILKKEENGAPFSSFDQLSPMSNVLDSIGVGIAVFHAEEFGKITPAFCNEQFLSLSGLTRTEFLDSITKDHAFGVHPDDFAKLRLDFAEAYGNRKPLVATLRVKSVFDANYKWVYMNASVSYNLDGSFDLYCVFTDAAEKVREKQVFAMRYKNLIESSKMAAVEALCTIHLNVSQDTCTIIYNALQLSEHTPVLTKGINIFILSVHDYINDDEMKENFVAKFKREALLEDFNKGALSIEMEVPMSMSDGRTIWCHQYATLTRNPGTNDVECVMSLVEDNRGIRMKRIFSRIMHSEYELVANLNVKTHLVTVISEENARGMTHDDPEGLENYDEALVKRMGALVDSEFLSDALDAMAYDRIISELENREQYICTFPASRALLGRDGVFQWRISYVDKSKKDIVFTRVNMISFLDKRQKVESNQSSLQIKTNAIATVAKSGLSKRNTILIADDVELNREMLRIIFEDEFEIIEAADGEEAIELIDKNYERLAIILLDLQMPKKTGLDVLIHLNMRGLNEHIPVMMVTGSSSKDLNLRSLEYGISDIVNKPFDSKIVKRRALNLIELYSHKEEVEHQLEEWKADAIKMHDIADKNNELLINALSSLVEFRSLESGQHIKRVRVLTEVMLENWSIADPDKHFSKMEIDQISRASAMHDIGKVGIPDSILLKPGKLTPQEFDIMKTHTTLGCEMLENIKQEDDDDFYTYCYDICRYHHERSDGRGYPDGLKDDEIPVWAQIVSVVDVFDALTSPRVYKPAYSAEKAVEMIQNGECGCFSKKLLTCFNAAKDAMIEIQKRLSDEAEDE